MVFKRCSAGMAHFWHLVYNLICAIRLTGRRTVALSHPSRSLSVGLTAKELMR
jgi:hypothetical protein